LTCADNRDRYNIVETTMKNYLTWLLLSVGVLQIGPPAWSHLAQEKLSASAQEALNEKLMSTLWFVPRGQCDVTGVQSLLQQGASPNSRNSDGNTLTALMVAAQNGCADIVKLLLDGGADVNAKASAVSAAGAHGLDGITVLFSAAASENLAVVKMLLDHGADLHAQTSDGSTVMLRASTNEIVQTFLDRGLDINARDKHGYTLLIRSAEWGGRHRPSIAFLLAHGADPNAKTDDGTTALQLAKGIKHPADVDLLVKAGAKE
jgi:uncharacterized protein